MSHNDHLYHSRREQHCRSMAKLASDPDVRRRHEQLAELHAGLASQFGGVGQAESQASIQDLNKPT